MLKNKVEVIIGGNIYALQGEEPEEQIQKVASLINGKIQEIQKNDVSKKLSSSQIHMLTAINLGNEYLKAKEDSDIYYKDLELYSHELEKCSKENLALLERMEEMSLELAKLKVNKNR